MNRPDEDAAKKETAKQGSAGAAADLGDKLVEQLFASREDFQDARRQLRPAEDLNTLLWRISHRLDYEHAERKTIDYRLVAIEGQMKAIASQAKRRASRSFIRYRVAICVGVAGTLAWQSYGEEAKQTIRHNGARTRLEPGGQADDRELGEAAGPFRKHRCSTERVGGATSGKHCSRDRRAKRANRGLFRPGAGEADDTEP